MTRMLLGLRSFSLCSAGTKAQSCIMGTRPISLFFVVTSAGGTSRMIIHGNVRMHQHFLTTVRLVKNRPNEKDVLDLCPIYFDEILQVL